MTQQSSALNCAKANKRLKRDCQRVAFSVSMSRSGYGCCG
ncbi:hypothetical protein CG015_18260 [Vibrio anguillarum]|nr:hypothetical protein CG015_18260 [Vibrio anguillarum]